MPLGDKKHVQAARNIRLLNVFDAQDLIATLRGITRIACTRVRLAQARRIFCRSSPTAFGARISTYASSGMAISQSQSGPKSVDDTNWVSTRLAASPMASQVRKIMVACIISSPSGGRSGNPQGELSQNLRQILKTSTFLRRYPSARIAIGTSCLTQRLKLTR
jgi:hypothetical protein